jgi:hypothetical protein
MPLIEYIGQANKKQGFWQGFQFFQTKCSVTNVIHDETQKCSDPNMID